MTHLKKEKRKEESLYFKGFFIGFLNGVPPLTEHAQTIVRHCIELIRKTKTYSDLEMNSLSPCKRTLCSKEGRLSVSTTPTTHKLNLQEFRVQR